MIVLCQSYFPFICHNIQLWEVNLDHLDTFFLPNLALNNFPKYGDVIKRNSQDSMLQLEMLQLIRPLIKPIISSNNSQWTRLE